MRRGCRRNRRRGGRLRPRRSWRRCRCKDLAAAHGTYSRTPRIHRERREHDVPLGAARGLRQCHSPSAAAKNSCALKRARLAVLQVPVHNFEPPSNCCREPMASTCAGGDAGPRVVVTGVRCGRKCGLAKRLASPERQSLVVQSISRPQRLAF